jgi:hypothetical protein
MSIMLHELVLDRRFNGRGRKINNLSLWSALSLLVSSSDLLLSGIGISADAIDEELVALSLFPLLFIPVHFKWQRLTERAIRTSGISHGFNMDRRLSMIH